MLMIPEILEKIFLMHKMIIKQEKKKENKENKIEEKKINEISNINLRRKVKFGNIDIIDVESWKAINLKLTSEENIEELFKISDGKKNKEKEIISIKVEANKELKSKEKNKFRNSILNNRTEQQNRKMVNIYGMGIMPTNLSKNKYTIANKMSNNKSKPNSSLIKRNIIKSNYTTNRKISTNNKENNKTHLKSSSIQLFNTAIKNSKYVSKYTSTFNNSKSYVSKINNLIRTKKKTSNQKYNNNKSLIKNNFLVNSYNNKYMKLFRSTQYKNNLFFTKKIDKN